jgi:hypothetical protein
MQQFGGKDSKRHFTVVMGNKEHGLYVSSTPSSAAKKAVTKLCAANKSKKVEFEIREITQGSKKKTYGPYEGHIEKLKEPIELKGRIINYKPVAKLSRKKGMKKGGMSGGMTYEEFDNYYKMHRYNHSPQSKNFINYLEKYYPEFVETWKKLNLKPKNQQDLYLEKFPKNLQDMIIYKKNPRQHSYNIKKPKNKNGNPIINITNKQKLLNYIEHYPYSKDLINALGMDVTILQKTTDKIKQAIKDKIEEYDPEQ